MGAGTGTGKRGRPKGSKSGYTVSDKALAQRQKVSPFAKNNNAIPLENEDRDYNVRYIEHIMHIHEIAQHADVKDPESLRACFINYLALCQRDGFKVGNLAASASMGVTERSVSRWATDNRPEYRELSQFVRTTCAIFREGMIADQKINPVIGIFWQRNFDGLRNDTEQTQPIQETERDGDSMTAAEYREKYGKLLEE